MAGALLPYERAGENARLAMDTIAMKPTRGIPSSLVHVMDIGFLEQVGGHPAGAYMDVPDAVYLDFQQAIGTCLIDQYLAENPRTMSQTGYDSGTERTATTGAERTVLDGIVIDSPEAVAEHLERFVLPALEKALRSEQDTATVDTIIEDEKGLQELFGPNILKAPYGAGFNHFPKLRYGAYGYANYFTAYLMYPELMERDFSLQADLAVRRNVVAARAIIEGGMPRILRSDHDMADSKGTLVDIRSLDRIWFPHFARSIEPYLKAGIRLIWHCDGDLMQMVPRLIEAGMGGFQGFQYEDGMDYKKICRMTTRDGDPLMIWAGVSVTRTLPFGTPNDVRRELAWLVEQGPPVGLFLAASSSVTPGVPHENLHALIEGLQYYRTHGRQ